MFLHPFTKMTDKTKQKTVEVNGSSSNCEFAKFENSSNRNWRVKNRAKLYYRYCAS